MKNLLYLLLVTLSFACSKEPKPIEYGKDACDFCEMTIVDRAHSAQAVSEKGKQFKYDAIECMVNDLHEHAVPMTIQQVADFSQPGTMIPVEEAIFIINDSISSPMGANLAAVKKGSDLATLKSADTFEWDELYDYLQNEGSILRKE